MGKGEIEQALGTLDAVQQVFEKYGAIKGYTSSHFSSMAGIHLFLAEFRSTTDRSVEEDYF